MPNRGDLVKADTLLVGIVTLNRKGKLKRALEECRGRGFPHVLVLDSGSTDGTREYLDQQPSIRKIFLERNEGSSGGFNAIIRYFVESTDHRWLLLLDDDAYPSFSFDDLICHLRNLSQTNVPACALKVTYPDGKLCEMNRPGINVLNKSPFSYAGRDFHVSESSKECLVDFASFTGLLLRNDTVASVGIVSKQFFIYSDDTYYTLSISSKIGKILYSPQFCLIHDCNRSSRRMTNHGPLRVEKDVVNKIVMIREYARFKATFIGFYVARLVAMNPKLCFAILRAAYKGMLADKTLYRNEPVRMRNSADTIRETSLAG
ncbi:MAG: glycosyltransferase [Candidatus Acidiferrales bacterium]